MDTITRPTKTSIASNVLGLTPEQQTTVKLAQIIINEILKTNDKYDPKQLKTELSTLENPKKVEDIKKVLENHHLQFPKKLTDQQKQIDILNTRNILLDHINNLQENGEVVSQALLTELNQIYKQIDQLKSVNKWDDQVEKSFQKELENYQKDQTFTTQQVINTGKKIEKLIENNQKIPYELVQEYHAHYTNYTLKSKEPGWSKALDRRIAKKELGTYTILPLFIEEESLSLFSEKAQQEINKTKREINTIEPNTLSDSTTLAIIDSEKISQKDERLYGIEQDLNNNPVHNFINKYYLLNETQQKTIVSKVKKIDPKSANLIETGDPRNIATALTTHPKVIRRMYREMSKIYHPDVNPNKPETEKEFKELSLSYEKLKNPIELSAYVNIHNSHYKTYESVKNIPIQTQITTSESSISQKYTQQPQQSIPPLQIAPPTPSPTRPMLPDFSKAKSALALPQKMKSKFLTTKASQAAKKSTQALPGPTKALNLKQKAKKLAGKALKKIAPKLAAAGTGIGIIYTVGSTAMDIAHWIYNNREFALALFTWLQIQLAALLSTWAGTLAIAGGLLGSFIPGVGTVWGATAGGIIGGGMDMGLAWLKSKGGVSEATHSALDGGYRPARDTAGRPVYRINQATSEVEPVIEQTNGLFNAITGGGGPGIQIVAESFVIGPIFMAVVSTAVLTFLTIATIIIAFTVPNPIGTTSPYTIPPEYDADGNLIPLPTYSPPLSTGPGGLEDTFMDAANAACVPEEVMAAILKNESGNTYNNWTDADFAKFSYDGTGTPWWETAGPGGQSCYDGHFTASNGYPGSDCEAGYCYDTCTETGLCDGQKVYEATDGTPPGSKDFQVNINGKTYTYWTCDPSAPGVNASLLGNTPCVSYANGGQQNQMCPIDTDGSQSNGRSLAVCTDYDVYGLAQFEKNTFYSNNCRHRDGSDPQNLCIKGGKAKDIIDTRGSNPKPNRCNATDIIQAMALKLRSHASSASCDTWSVKEVCQVARAYCGDCGTIENAGITQAQYEANPRTYPCWPVYEPGSRAACGNNYCDLVAKQVFGSDL